MPEPPRVLLAWSEPRWGGTRTAIEGLVAWGEGRELRALAAEVREAIDEIAGDDDELDEPDHPARPEAVRARGLAFARTCEQIAASDRADGLRGAQLRGVRRRTLGLVGSLAPFLADLAADRPPRWPAGALLSAWRECDDVDEMIAILLKGAAVGVFETAEVSRWEKDGQVQRWLLRLRHAGRFHRVDVARADGAEGVRRCFPDFPDDWSSALDAQLDEKGPLDRLLSDLRNRRPVSVDREAAQRAWRDERDVFTMLEILRLLGRPLPELPASNVRGGGVAEHEAQKRRILDAVRAALPPWPAPSRESTWRRAPARRCVVVCARP